MSKSNIDQIDSVNLNISQAELRNANNLEKGSAGILRKRQKSASTNQIVTGSNNDIKTKRPKNTRLKQQQLPAWQPILTASTVLPLFFVVGCIFIIIGSVLLYYTTNINEQIVDYTDCKADFDNKTLCSALDYTSPNTNCTCTLYFTLDKNFESPVYVYYGLKNFYQNHRRYVKSRDDNQLLGKSVTTSSISSDCTPYDYNKNTSLVYAPCGAIANSLFNDSYNLYYLDKSLLVPFLRTGIAWTSDKNVKFDNPTDWNNTMMPKNWRKSVTELDTDPTNNGYKNEDLIVWMRTAALPNFRKFHRRVDHQAGSNFSSGLPKGSYMLKINYNYPVSSFDGEKSFIISTTSWIGGKNIFLGTAYLVIGILCVLLGVTFLVIHLMYGKKINEDFNNLKTDS